MNDEQNQHQTDAHTVSDHDQPVSFERPLDREALLSSLHRPSNIQPRPVSPLGVPGQGKAQGLSKNEHRQTMPEREEQQMDKVNQASFEPNDQPRPDMPEHEKSDRPSMAGHDESAGQPEEHQTSTVKNDSEDAKGDMTCSAMTSGGQTDTPDPGNERQETETSQREAPPASADLVTVEEAVIIFAEAGLPRHIRTIQKYCAKKKGRALVSYQIPTENGIRYMIERSSIERFISDATQQAPTGKLEEEPAPQPTSREETTTQSANNVAADLAVYDHPYVKRLEDEIEKEKERYASLQMRFETAMDISNQRLVELQQASAVAQSESLGRFLIESKRMEIEPEQSPAPVHNPPAQGESVVQ